MAKSQSPLSDSDIDRSSSSADVAFTLLGSRHRRYILYYLTQCTGSVELRELAEQLVMWDETAIHDQERFITTMYHVHLPKLEESGILRFDSNGQLIELDETADELVPYLALAAEDDLQTQVFAPESTYGLE